MINFVLMSDFYEQHLFNLNVMNKNNQNTMHVKKEYIEKPVYKSIKQQPNK